MIRIRTVADPGLAALHDRMERLMARLLRPLEPEGAPQGWAPRVDIHETADRLRITVELPGVERDGIDIAVEGSYLRVSGVRAEPPSLACMRWHQMEIVYGPFERILALPFPIDPARVSATYADGFLRIEVLRGAPRTVPIDAG